MLPQLPAENMQTPFVPDSLCIKGGYDLSKNEYYGLIPVPIYLQHQTTIYYVTGAQLFGLAAK